MNPEEYQKLELLDAKHWYYTGKRKLVLRWLRRYIQLKKDDLFVDVGCGMGNLLSEVEGHCRLVGIDCSRESICRARSRIASIGGHLLRARIEELPLASGSAIAITVLDVLEHLDNDNSGLKEVIRVVRPGGIIIITVPALRWLWSDWDDALHHRRRYTKRELIRLCGLGNVEVLFCSYFNSIMLPVIFLVRLLRRVLGRRALRAEDRMPPRMLNGLLRAIMVWPGCWSWFQPPIGVSLIAILRRRAPTVLCVPGSTQSGTQVGNNTNVGRSQVSRKIL